MLNSCKSQFFFKNTFLKSGADDRIDLQKTKGINMKKILLSLAVVLAVGTTGAVAANDGVFDTTLNSGEGEFYDNSSVYLDGMGWYLGLGYSFMGVDLPNGDDIESNAVTMVGGYNMHQNVAIEGRYTFSAGDPSYNINIPYDGISGSFDLPDSSMSNFVLFVKPNYTIDALNIYGLIGYGQSEIDRYDSRGLTSELSIDGFQYGAGLSYTFVPHWSVSVEYASMFDSDGDAVSGFFNYDF